MQSTQDSNGFSLRAAGIVLTAVGVCTGPVQADDPIAAEPVDVTGIETESGPLDLPGHKAAPKTASESSKPAAEQTGASPAPKALREGFGPDGMSWFDWSRATGDWGGARTSLEDAGLTIAGSFTLDWSSVLSGGADKTAYSRRFLDLNATFDLEKLCGWTGGSVYVDFYHYAGETGNPPGDAQGTDALIGRRVDQIAEVWFQQVLFDGKVRLKAGKIDANVDFAALPSPAGFVSANGTWDPNLLAQPTYPDPSTGVLAFVYPTENLYVGFGIFDGATQDGVRTGGRGPATFFSDSKSDSWYLIGEAGLTWSECGSLGAGQISFGGWGHTGDFDRFDGDVEDGTSGFYVMAEQQILRRCDQCDAGKERGLFAFARWAYADKNVAFINNHFSAGLVLKGTFHGRDDDECGVMWSFADLSSASGADGDEHNIELFYKLKLFGSVTLIPDVQYIRNPSGDPTIDDAWLGTLSLVISF